MSNTTPWVSSSTESHVTHRKTLGSWYLYDVAISVIDALMVTFVFSVYLTSSAFGTPEHTSQALGIATVIAAVIVAVFAPLIGRISDRSGRKTPGLALLTGICVLATAACFFVAPAEQFLLLGVTLLSTANAAKELASVNYYAMLPVVTDRDHLGKASGRGWACGYIGSTLGTAFVLFGFLFEDSPFFLGLPTENAVNVRAVALFCAAWCLMFAMPLVVSMRRQERRLQPPKPLRKNLVHNEGLWGAYRQIFRMVLHLWRTDRKALFFLLTSAVFRDGVAGMFTFGGVVATGTFGFSLAEVTLFALAGNLVAGLGALVGGQLDDRVGPKTVIVVSLMWMILFTLPLLFLNGPSVFWICGLAVCVAVGPTQASSRAYLGHLTTPGTEGALYGLYATTGRALTFLAPLMFTIAIGLSGQQRWGIAGVISLVILGLLMLLPLPDPRRRSDLGSVEVHVGP
ncbi:MAG: MFS transporter [Kocuria sp.]|nr:MFS transporter [Kocuria sp.]